jgi:hypothetical protein
MTSTRLAISRRVRLSPNARTSAAMFFLASGRDIARITGLRGLRRNLGAGGSGAGWVGLGGGGVRAGRGCKRHASLPPGTP